MKKAWQETLYAIWMGMAVPGLILAILVMFWEKDKSESNTEPETLTAPVSLSVLVRWPDGVVEQMDMDAYLTGVVLAEMPAFFESEALKAQAVAARTYARKASVTGGKHGDGSVCTDYTCCQAYQSPEEYLEKGGTRDDIQKVRSAVLDTSGYVLTYNGELIEAVYFSCSGGKTEDAVAVWGTDYPYLRSTDSPGEENAAFYSETKVFTPKEFEDALGIVLSTEPAQWLGEVTRTAGDGVDTMEIGGVKYSGVELRAALGLRSTAFTIAVQDNEIRIVTYGYGHRVGMSQYGADAMAAAGSDFRQILSHYYPGTVLEKCLQEGG
ncbi:MAG: stage II sporulation protein D [Faecousia sp.]